MIRAHRPEYSVDLCFALADDLQRAGARDHFPDQHITPAAGPESWPAVSPIMRPRGAEAGS
jgi:hypothetical protein